MKYLFTFLIFTTNLVFSQVDYTNDWQDLYSYKNVKDFTVVENKLYAACENAMFIYDLDTGEVEKISSVNGLSGAKMSSISYDEISSNIVVGYENGLVEIFTQDNEVIPLTGIRDNIILVNKSVNGFYRNGDKTYLFGEFGVLLVDLEKFEFGDSYKLSYSNSESYIVNQITIHSNILYAATNNGVFSIDLAENPIDFNNWNEIVNGSVSNILNISDKIYFSRESIVYEISNPTQNITNVDSSILNLSTYENYIVITTAEDIYLLDLVGFDQYDQVDLSLATDYEINTSKSIIIDDNVFLSTSTNGVLKTTLNDKINYTELHPDGPSSNDVFTITVSNNQKWIVYGGYRSSGDGLKKAAGVDFFDENKWGYLSYSQSGSAWDLTKAIVDPYDHSKVLIGSNLEGVVELNNYSYNNTWDQVNTNGILPGHNEVGEDIEPDWVSDLIIDNNNMVWVGNSRARDNKIFSMYNGQESGVDRWVKNIEFPAMQYNGGVIKALYKMFVDSNNNIYAGTRFNGLLVFNADEVDNEIDRETTVLNNTSGKGNLPSNQVFSVVADENNKVWIGTSSGLVVFNDYENLYNSTKSPASTLIFEENDVAKALLSDVQVNDIIIDLSGNKWFATEDAGVFQTSSDGQTTFNTFTISNSPLPSNKIIDLELDENTGEIYIVTENGVLIYDGKSEPFGTSITPIVAYPNPAIKTQIGHETITIVAKDGNGIPDDTNVKIMDVSGKLVYETNVSTSNGFIGGKVVWDKTNLSGNHVVSGVYIVLLSSPDGSETTTTKIAIVN